MELIQIPRWEQLPGIALYMDQILLVLGGMLEPFTADDTPMVTATMINNYVKMKLTPPPEKKKYSREHLAWFFLICLLKKVLSMQEIAALKQRLEETMSPEESYDRFCEELELRLQLPDGPDTKDCEPMLAYAVRSVVCKLRVEQILAEKPEKSEEN